MTGDRQSLLPNTGSNLILVYADPPCRDLVDGEAIVEVRDVPRGEWHPLWWWQETGVEVCVFPSVAAAQSWVENRNRDRYDQYEIKVWQDGRLILAPPCHPYRWESRYGSV